MLVTLPLRLAVPAKFLLHLCANTRSYPVRTLTLSYPSTGTKWAHCICMKLMRLVFNI